MLIYGSQIRTALIAMVICLMTGSASAQDDPSQRPLPLPERGVTDLPQHMELLKRLRSLVESQQKNSEQPGGNGESLPRLPELPSPADSNSTPQKANETVQEPSPFQPQQLQQFQDALKNLASQLPPGFVPPDLGSIPPDQLRRAMENPLVQEHMKQMLEQFAKDGVLPKPGQTSGPQLPVPPQTDGKQNNSRQGGLRRSESRDDEANETSQPDSPAEQNNPSEDAERAPARADGSPEMSSPGSGQQKSPRANESATDESDMTDQPSSDSNKEAPPGSLRSLRSFLKRLAEDAGMKSPDPSTNPTSSSQSAKGSDPAPGDLSQEEEPGARANTDEQTMRTEPKNSLGTNSVPSTRRPLRKRDSAKPRTSPPIDSASSPAPDSNNSPAGPFPETSPQPLNRSNAAPGENSPENAPGSDASDTSPAAQDPASSNPPPGLRIDPEAARKQLEELQKTIERMKQMAEESDPKRSSNEERPSSNGQSDRSRSSDQERGSDSDSVAPSTGRNNRMANRPDSDNRNGDQLPESLPDVDEFLREQLKDLKLVPDPPPGSTSKNNSATRSLPPGLDSLEDRMSNPNRTTPKLRGSLQSGPRDLYMERPPQPDESQQLRDSWRRRNANHPGSDSSAEGNAKSDKPPIDIAKELEQGGFGSTLKKLVERAKEEAKKPRPPQEKSTDTPEIAGNAEEGKSAVENAVNGATEAAKKADPELSQSMAKMLDGLKDDLIKIAKDAKFNDPPERSGGDRSMTRPAPSESNSMIDTFRKSASEILAGPSRSSNSVSSAASNAATTASNALTGEFDFTPVLVLAGILATLAIAFFGLRHFKFRGEDAAEFQFAGPPLKPSEINSRADVVRAFHEFALRSAQSVQSWWTHRNVQQAILEKAPEYRAAVETLANTYEQARYLPVEQELSPEQLESARSALQQCSRKSNNG